MSLQTFYAQKIAFFVGDADVYVCGKALKQYDLSKLDVKYFSDLDMGKKEMLECVKQMDIAVVDIMHAQPASWLLDYKLNHKLKAKIYAMRSSVRTQDYVDGGFIFDEKVRAYFSYTTPGNIANMAKFLAARDLGTNITYQAPVIPPLNALFHPDAPDFFKSFKDFLLWYKKEGKYVEGSLWNIVAIPVTYSIDGKNAATKKIVEEYEKQKINTLCWIRDMKDWDKNFKKLVASFSPEEKLGSITGMSLRFASMLNDSVKTMYKDFNVPIVNAFQSFFTRKKDWIESPEGLNFADMGYQYGTPEIMGMIEPTPSAFKVPAYKGATNALIYEAADENIINLAERIVNWHKLKTKKNSEKKIILMYYNHGGGKGNIGASYLNVPRSIALIISKLKEEGYLIEGNYDEDEIIELLVKAGRNIGSWAKGELDDLIKQGRAEFIDINDYKKWLKKRPKEYGDLVDKDWGKPDEATTMAKDNQFIIPCIKLKNLILVPQPSRGWSEDPEKLYHDVELYPHHQYSAFYFWLQEIVKPDAIISLGTHGTLEWLPGKQLGLTHKCPPEVLSGTIPVLYPYVVDDVGEGIQAKRRGHAVILDHATPPFKTSGLYYEYSFLYNLISEHNSSMSEIIKREKFARIKTFADSIGIIKELKIKNFDEEALEKLEHYLGDVKSEMVPYGMHTYGISAKGEGLDETAEAIAKQSEGNLEEYKKLLKDCGPSEISSLINGLNGGFIPTALGNDPIRSPESLPTGKNFYSFDPNKVPSKEAWSAGKKAAEEIILSYKKKHNRYPEKVGVVLWSVETIRDQGINIATAMYLMGITPVWKKNESIKSLAAINAFELKRPRIDVHLQMSGLFRDMFPNVGLLLDKAVKMASKLKDTTNFIAINKNKIEKELINKGFDKAEAEKLALIRLFSAPPGVYGTKVVNFTSASGTWEKDEIVAEQGFIQVQSFGYSSDMWGESVIDAYRVNLKQTDATVHSRSSNLYGTMDNDDMFQYLGGLSMAVRQESGKDPEVYVSIQHTLRDGHIENLSETLGKEMRSRYLNPKWIEGMKKEKYAGAREMSEFLEYMWGWEVTTPNSVDDNIWKQTFEVYIEDKYNMDIKEFMEKENPWAYQNMAARMLEAIRKNHWDADKKTIEKLALEYAKAVVEFGTSGSDHTGDNPLLNQYTVNIISKSKNYDKELIEKFKKELERASGEDFEDMIEKRKELLEKLYKSIGKIKAAPLQPVTVRKAPIKEMEPVKNPETISGYKMIESDNNKKLEKEIKQNNQFENIFEKIKLWLIIIIVLIFVSGYYYEKTKLKE